MRRGSNNYICRHGWWLCNKLASWHAWNTYKIIYFIFHNKNNFECNTWKKKKTQPNNKSQKSYWHAHILYTSYTLQMYRIDNSKKQKGVSNFYYSAPIKGNKEKEKKKIKAKVLGYFYLYSWVSLIEELNINNIIIHSSLPSYHHIMSTYLASIWDRSFMIF